MPVMRTYACPDCGGQFRHLHMTRDEPPPSECELCHADMTDAQPELPRVNIGGSAISRAVDKTYGQLEQQGLTNLRDGLREGDVAGPGLPNNAVTQYAAQTGHSFFQGSTVAMPQAMAGARQGAAASAEILRAIQLHHQGRTP